MSAPPPDRFLFHLVQVPLWRAAQSAGASYFPPTFAADGGFTHLTAHAPLLLPVANQFYRAVPADVPWVVLVLDAAALQASAPGAVKYEPAAPVGAIAARDSDAGVLYPHLYGGIPSDGAGIVVAELPVVRAPGEGGEFLSIGGLDAYA
jgi:uncharacterized protein (DUF952 family)